MTANVITHRGKPAVREVGNPTVANEIFDGIFEGHNRTTGLEPATSAVKGSENSELIDTKRHGSNQLDVDEMRIEAVAKWPRSLTHSFSMS